MQITDRNQINFINNMKRLGIRCTPNNDNLKVKINNALYTPFAFLPDQNGVVIYVKTDKDFIDICEIANEGHPCQKEKILNIETILVLDIFNDMNLLLYEGEKNDVDSNGNDYIALIGWEETTEIAFRKCEKCGKTTLFDYNQGWCCRHCGFWEEGYEELQEHYLTYSDYINSDEWIEKKKNVLKRDNFTCVRCGKKGTRLHVHHLNYDNLYNEESNNYSDLITLCENCHKWMHESEEQ